MITPPPAADGTEASCGSVTIQQPADAPQSDADPRRILDAMTWSEMLGYYDDVHESERLAVR